MADWHSVSESDVFRKLQSSAVGLASSEAAARLQRCGSNAIEIERKINPLRLLLSQFKSLPVLLLITAAIVSLALGYLSPSEHDDASVVDSFLIFAILILNAVFGFYQEYKAEKSMEALRKLAAPHARAWRDGRIQLVPARDIVPGDILVLQEGDRIAADARLVESVSLYCDESSLTGESVPVEKRMGMLPFKTPLAERSNLIFMNMSVTRGKGRAMVVATGLQTEIGQIAKEIAEADEKTTPFQEEVEDLGKKIALGTLAIAVLVALVELLLREGRLEQILIAAISLAVAAIPEGLPAVVTVALALGTHRMLKQQALMRRLATVQNLGSVDTICTDKTGTLTENTMTVTRMYAHGERVDVTGLGHALHGEFSSKGARRSADDFKLLFTCAALCNDAYYAQGVFYGDPTEIAVLVPVYKAGMAVDSLRSASRRIGEIPFSSDTKRMSTLHRHEGRPTVFVKGAPEVVLAQCDLIWEKGKIRKLSAADRERILFEVDAMADDALRVLGFAFLPDIPLEAELKEKHIEKGLVFIGLMGMIDPPRSGVREALSDCRKAGIRVVMITGDNPRTAQAIGKELGFLGTVLLAEELDGMNEKELRQTAEQTSIYARASPKHKSVILKALKANRHTVAMTGDGVNDAPAIQNSDVGIAMGIRGTEVAKGASDMVLLDDNFVTIRNAIAEGRGIFDNIRKFIVYLLGANLAEVLVVFLVAILGWGFALTAVQLLWINLLTDALPALALGVDPRAPGIMERPPRPKSDRVINGTAVRMVLSMGIAATLVILWLFYHNLHDYPRAQTIAFTAFVFYEMVKVYAVRARYGTPLLSNNWLHLAVASSLLLQLAVLYTPLSSYFGVVPLNSEDWEWLAAGIFGYIVLLAGMLKAEELVLGKGEKPAISV